MTSKLALCTHVKHPNVANALSYGKSLVSAVLSHPRSTVATTVPVA